MPTKNMQKVSFIFKSKYFFIKNTHDFVLNMADKSRNCISIEQEILAENVKNFPCIFDKANQAYKQKDVVINAWNEVAKSLEFVESGKLLNFILSKTANGDVLRGYHCWQNEVF